jgi:phosphoribosyl-ATP pyrophosphohydrolase
MAKKETKLAPKKKAAPKKGLGFRGKLAGKLAMIASPVPADGGAEVLDRLWGVVTSRRESDPEISHSARLLSRGTAKVAQKFGEEAVECLIEAVAGNRAALISESADVLYHLIVMWVDAGVRPEEVWAELHRREGVSGVAEKASRTANVPMRIVGTRKIP